MTVGSEWRLFTARFGGFDVPFEDPLPDVIARVFIAVGSPCPTLGHNSLRDRGYAWRVQIRAVLFDLDNTLFDHPSSARAGVDAFLKHLGTECSDELTRSWFEVEEFNYNRCLKGTNFPGTAP